MFPFSLKMREKDKAQSFEKMVRGNRQRGDRASKEEV
jgi:hypothetical protein